MLEKLKIHIDTHLSFLHEKKLLVACSGGMDSVALADLLKKLNFTIALAHCNFSLRGSESDEDETFVLNLADKYSIPIFTETFETERFASEHKMSIQMAARELRYQWFEEIANDFKFDYVLTGHHADDDLETFFINLSRGTGLRGLTGIPEVNDQIIRPLKPFSRNEILEYAKKEKLYWREDSSNSKTDYLRNKIRLEVLPNYKKIGDTVVKSFQKTQENLLASQSLVEDYMALISNLVMKVVDGGYSIDIQKLQELPNTKALVYELLFPFGFTAWDDISDLLEAQSGKQIFSNSHRLIKDRDVLLVTEIVVKEFPEEYLISEDEKEITFPINLMLNATDKIGSVDANTIYVDKDKIQFPLQLRKWREGDIFFPFGMKGNKKLSKFFKDEKLSLMAKEKIWLLLSEQDVIWVIGLRADDRFKVTPKTENILKINSLPLNQT